MSQGNIFVDNPNFVKLLIFFSGIGLGSLFKGYTVEYPSMKTCTNEIAKLEAESYIPSHQHLDRVQSNEFLDFSKSQFACNSQAAYEELTRLHFKRIQLETHNKRGDANRDRTSTILRKYQSASSAESSFRSCMNSMIPELLDKWDEDLKGGKVSLRKWSQSDEVKINGITLQTLEETANAIDSDQ